MYTITFYSFKGGVGRTLALVNVACELVRIGKKVVVVDFDLEAPGVDTFPRLRPAAAHQGVVEFVSSFAATRISPDVKDFVYEVSNLSDGPGRMWIMPAGKGDDAYGQRLASIDWQKLYSDPGGFLLIEDLRSQINVAFEPDYLLIDSRTGHTDVSGICTRQLPNAVVFVFIPSPQNLAGLDPVVTRVRSEKRRAAPPIVSHFVMANVPNIDDEELMLERLAAESQQRLQYGHLAATIHHYASFALIDQAIFTLDRPKTRLAHEYRSLATSITEQNLEDKTVALRTLESQLGGVIFRPASLWTPAQLEDTLPQIEAAHAGDPEVLVTMARVRRRFGENDRATALLTRAESLGYVNPNLYAMRAELQQLADDRDGAREYSTKFLNSPNVEFDDLNRVLSVVRRVNPQELRQLAFRPAVLTLPPRSVRSLVARLMNSREELQAGSSIADVVLRRQDISAEELAAIGFEQVICLIGLGRFADAVALSRRVFPLAQGPAIVAAQFNHAVATWADSGGSNTSEFHDTFLLDQREDRQVFGANYEQCLGFAHLIVGQKAEAEKRIVEAIKLATKEGTREFSVWTYLNVSVADFVADCRIMLQLPVGEPVRPGFMDQAK